MLSCLEMCGIFGNTHTHIQKHIFSPVNCFCYLFHKNISTDNIQKQLKIAWRELSKERADCPNNFNNSKTVTTTLNWVRYLLQNRSANFPTAVTTAAVVTEASDTNWQTILVCHQDSVFLIMPPAAVWSASPTSCCLTQVSTELGSVKSRKKWLAFEMQTSNIHFFHIRQFVQMFSCKF